MPRPRRDGTPAAPPDRRKFSELLLRKLKPRGRAYATWDTHQRGLCIVVQRSGHKSWRCVYSRGGRARWYYIGAVDAIGLADARKLASRVMFKVAEGQDTVTDE